MGWQLCLGHKGPCAVHVLFAVPCLWSLFLLLSMASFLETWREIYLSVILISYMLHDVAGLLMLMEVKMNTSGCSSGVAPHFRVWGGGGDEI